MKFRITLYIVSMFILFACSNDNEAKLEGRWQVRSIETPQKTVETDSLFWSFDMGVFEIQTLRSETPHFAEQIFGVYTLQGDSVMMSIPDNDYFNMAKDNRYIDWKTRVRKFAIRELSSSSLKLSTNDTIYTFRKYY